MVRSPNRRRFVFYLDALLFVAYLLLLSPRMTGLPLHEWLGIAFALPLLVHLLLAWPWIWTATRRLLSPGRTRDAVNTALNASLFITTTVVVVSGLVISQVSLRWLGVDTINDRVWRGMHNRWTTWMWLSVSAHIAMNWRWIGTAARSYLPRRHGEQ
jgi:hypothetical protein